MHFPIPIVYKRVYKRGAQWILMSALIAYTGCLNGGGQIKPKPGQSPKDLIKTLETIYMENVSCSSVNCRYFLNDFRVYSSCIILLRTISFLN